MGKHKKIMCKVCYKEMRNDHLTRHLKQHTEKDTNNPRTNIYVTNNYNTTSGVSTERNDEENENKDEELKKHLIKIENEYQEKLVQGKKNLQNVGRRCSIIPSLTKGDERRCGLLHGESSRL